MSDRFTGELWQSITDIYGAILAHPFLAGLTDGSLPHGTFAFYVVQDALSLRRYAEALAAVASRAPDTAGTEMFARHAAGVVAVEQALHDSLLADPGVDPASVDVAEAAPTTLAYTSYLLATIRGGSYAEGVGAVLPGYWIYWEVGKQLPHRGSPDPATSAGSTPTAAMSSAMPSAGRWPSPTSKAPTSPGPSASAYAGTSARPAATSGCSGTWATASKAGHCDKRRARAASDDRIETSSTRQPQAAEQHRQHWPTPGAT